MISGADEPEYIEYFPGDGDELNNVPEQLTTSEDFDEEFIEVPPEN